MSIFKQMLGLLGTIIKTGFQATALIIVVAGGFAYLTKPKDETFGEIMAENLPVGTQTMGKIGINKMAKINDWVFIKIAETPKKILPSQYHIGAVHNWFPIGPK